jgi:hypothetical protein
MVSEDNLLNREAFGSSTNSDGGFNESASVAEL